MRDKVIAVKYICASAGELSDKSMCGHVSIYFDKQGHRCMAHGNKKCIHKCKKGRLAMSNAILAGKDALVTVSELLKFGSIKETAKEIGVTQATISLFLKSNGTNVYEIKTKFRLEYLKDNPGTTVEQFMEVFGVKERTATMAVQNAEAVYSVIPDEDFYLISELLQDLTVKEVAEKWDVQPITVRDFLANNNTSDNGIKYSYRSKYILNHPRLTNSELAKSFRCSTSVVSLTKVRMRKDGLLAQYIR